ncbi:MAG: hypothetical protein ACOC80_12500 [Petrotogales bacterium]
MTRYCSICGEELYSEEEPNGICDSCRFNRIYDYYIDDYDFYVDDVEYN